MHLIFYHFRSHMINLVHNIPFPSKFPALDI